MKAKQERELNGLRKDMASANAQVSENAIMFNKQFSQGNKYNVIIK